MWGNIHFSKACYIFVFYAAFGWILLKIYEWNFIIWKISAKSILSYFLKKCINLNDSF